MKKLMEEVKKVAREFVERSYVFFTIHETPSVDWELDFPVTRKSLMVLTSILLEFESTPDFMKHIAQIYDIINTPRSARARRAWMKDLQSVGI